MIAVVNFSKNSGRGPEEGASHQAAMLRPIQGAIEQKDKLIVPAGLEPAG